MYASIRRYRIEAGAIDDVMHLADIDLADRLSEERGFVDYQVMDTGGGTVTSVTIFDDEDQCLRSNDLAAEFVRDYLAGFEIERFDLFGGEVMVSRAADKVLQPADHRGAQSVSAPCRSPRVHRMTGRRIRGVRQQLEALIEPGH